MKTKVCLWMTILAGAFFPARANFVVEVQTRIGQVASELPVRRKNPEMLFNYDIVFATNASYRALVTTVSNNWRNVLASLSLCATNQFERLLVLGARDRFGADFYMDFMDELVTMKTNGLISAKEFSWARSTEEPELERYLDRKYRTPRVRALVERFKVAEPMNDDWDDVLSGVAYTNYLNEVEAGMWGENPPQ